MAGQPPQTALRPHSQGPGPPGAGGPEQPGAGGPGRNSYTGTIDGAEYRVETPADWNGTLLLFSHGYFPVGLDLRIIQVTNSPEAEAWFLDHGYALAASKFRSPNGYHVDVGYEDQLRLLGWFDANVGRPRQVIATGQSMGDVAAAAAGVEPMCWMSGGPPASGAVEPS